MNQIKYCLPVLLLLSIMVGCDNEPEESPEEEIRTLTVTETTGQGSEKVTTKQQFFYETGKLVQHTTTQTFTDLFCQTEYTWTVSTQIGYESGKVIVSDDAGNVSTYLMDDNGRAESCIRNEPSGNIRYYTFSYSPDNGILSGIKEEMNGKVYSEITLAPSTVAGKMTITGKVDNFGNTYIASTDNDSPGISNETSKLPWVFLAESYPLSFHEEALYANILGTPLPLLPGRLDIEGSNEVTTYSYTTDKKGYVTSCAVRTGTTRAAWSRYIEYSYDLVLSNADLRILN